MQIRVILLIFCFLFLQNLSKAQAIRVAAASSMTDFLLELESKFEKETGIELEVISNSSGTIANQIQNGAPFDVFLSANEKYTNALFQKGIGINQPMTFAYSQLVFWSKHPIESISNTLTNDNCKSIAIAQPELAPFGSLASLYITDSLQLGSQVKNKMVYGNNISMINQYIYAQSVDAAFTSLSSFIKLKKTQPDFWTIIEPHQLGSIAQSALLLNNQGSSFINYLFQNEISNETLLKYGYMLK
ncbi:molybdate ABC transporter substrate-binding protein [Reichenbachiella ulvae]|uniref:Molybdate ABC transporter substrate-binding protein n=1 Tax=Reichenbachiella ulvae TaxID=2980104 RepID=A0ABT3CS14_9BACT|nr:molybdate ABC transporter substrate-binding protein [Reichenbachiella ulvae]MCV9386407.1 molybdate ABC transporter substrate-binding protein [Reichenbachiella ulvae]